MRGHILQESLKNSSVHHLIKGPVGFFVDLVVVDGLCFAVSGDLLINGLRFDESTYGGFDFYDIDMCFSVLEKGKKIACCDILIQHRSVGDINDKPDWTKSRDKFISKWEAKGVKFPVTKDYFLSAENIQLVDV